MNQELTSRVFITLGQASVIAVIAGTAIHRDIDALQSAALLDLLGIAFNWFLVQALPSSFSSDKRTTKPIGLLETVVVCGIPFALSAFVLGALYGGASHAPHIAVTLLCVVVGTITGRRLGEVYPLRRMLRRLG